MITANFKNDFCNDSICSLGYIKAKVKKKKEKLPRQNIFCYG